MTDLNRIVIIGRLTKDAEMKYTNTGTAVMNLSIANNEGIKKGETWEDYANFFDVTVWGKTAESLSKFLLKGKQIAIEGRLHQDRWDDQDGTKRYRVKINASSIQLLGGGKKEEGTAPAQEPAVNDYKFEDDTIPF